MAPKIITPSCHPYDPRISNAFGYQPALAPGIAFTVLFFISAVTHLFQAIRYRSIWLGLFVVGAGCECLGWIARIAAHKCAYSPPMFTMQISLLIFAPAWTTAGIYVILFRMIPILGPKSSPFPAKTSLLICLGIDILSLALQAAGGGLAGRAFSADVDTQPGVYTMVSGILVQLVSTITYSVFMSIVFVRAKEGILRNRSLKWLSVAMIVTVVCMIGRNVYRAVELLEGWRGMLNTQERWVIGLDGVLMVVAVYVLNVLNPGRLLKNAVETEGVVGETEDSREKGSRSEESDSV